MITNISITPQDLLEITAETRLESAIQAFPEDVQESATNAVRVWVRLMARDLEVCARDAAAKGVPEGWLRYMANTHISSKRDMKYATIAASYVAELFRIRGFETMTDTFDVSYPTDPKSAKFANSGVILKVAW